MKRLLAGLGIGALLLASGAWAQETSNDNTNAHGSVANPAPPASQTTTTPTPTADSGTEKSRRTALREKCLKQADEQNLTAKARTDYLHSCRTAGALQ